MSNWYLLKSKVSNEENNAFDVLIDLDKIFTIRASKLESENIFRISMDYTHEDIVVAIFETEEDMRQELANILKSMNADQSLANTYVIHIAKSKKQMMEEAMKKLL